MTIKNEIKVLKTQITNKLKDIIHKIKRLFVKSSIITTNGKLKIGENICVFCSFAIGGIKNSTWKYLEELKENGFSICLVSNAKIENEDLSKLKNLCFEITERENFGGDFAAYKYGILKHQNLIQKSKTLLIANDSVIGPVHPLKNMLDEMQEVKCDFWGAVDYHDIWKPQHYHVGSFFILCNNKVLNSDVFWGFWQNYKITSSRKKTILLGEIQFSQTLIKNNFQAQSFINRKKILNLIEQKGVLEVFNLAVKDMHIFRLKPFLKKSLNQNSQDDLKTFLTMQSIQHKLQLILITYFKYPFIKKDILSKDFISKLALLDFLDNSKLNISKEDILKELK
jgi:lipopolysaccharide biosynthesis protein